MRRYAALALTLLFLLLLTPFASAKIFSLSDSIIPSSGCSILGCVMQGDIDMNGHIIYNATFVNATVHEVDPVFTAWLVSTYGPENQSTWGAINAVNSSLANYYLVTNPAGYINQSYADTLYYPVGNPSGYITSADLTPYLLSSDQRYNETSLVNAVNASLANETEGRVNNDTYIIGLIGNSSGNFVLKTGDNMTGNLNMTNNNITDVNTLYVHNISGHSPIYISSDMISANSINATNFYGNINGQNGTIFGMTIVNGTITNMHVSESAIFNTSLLPEINDTWSLGSENFTWKNFYVGNLYAANITGGNIYSYFPDGTWLFMQPGNGTNTYVFYFNETKLNETLSAYALNSSLANYYLISNPQGFINESYANETYALNSSLANYALNSSLANYYLNSNPAGYINETFANATYALNSSLAYYLLITDQRYNETGLIDAVNASLSNYYLASNPQGFINESYANATYALNNSLSDYALNSSLSNYYLASNPRGFINDSFANATYLLQTDQRYNETSLIISVNDSLYVFVNVTNATFQAITANFSYVYGLIGNETDGRVNNDTYLYGIINATNASLINYYLVSNPQGFINDTYLAGVLMNYYNKTEVDALIASVNQTTYINLTNNITQNFTSIYNLTNNITQNFTTIYNLTQNITNDYYTNITQNFTTVYNISNDYYTNITNNITQNFTSIYNTTNNITQNFTTVYNISNDYYTNITQNFTTVYNTTTNITNNITQNFTTINNITQYYNDTNLTNMIMSVNTTANIQSLGFNTTLQLQTVFLLITDQRYNDTAMIQAVNNSLVNYALNSSLANYYLASNPSGYLNGAGVVTAVGNWSADKPSYSTTAQDWSNDTASFYSIANPQGFINNSALAPYALNSSLANYYLNTNPQGFINDTYANNTYVNTNGDTMTGDLNMNTSKVTFNNNNTCYVYYNTTESELYLVCPVTKFQYPQGNQSMTISPLGFNKRLGSTYQFGYLDNTTFTQMLYGNSNTTVMYFDIYSNGAELDIQALGTNKGPTAFGNAGIFPSTDLSSPIGNSTRRWSAIYVQNVTANVITGRIVGYYNITEDYANDSASWYSILNPQGFINGTGVVSAVGNWSAEKINYSTSAQDWTNDTGSFYSIANPRGFINDTYGNNTYLLQTDQRYNETNWTILNYYNKTVIDAKFLSQAGVFTGGTGLYSVVAPQYKGTGQIKFVNGSGQITGVGGANFIGGGVDNLDTYYAFYLGDPINGYTQYFVYPINNATSANLTATMFGNQTKWTGANQTVDYYLLLNSANGTMSRAMGFKSTALGYSSTAMGYNTIASGDYSTAFGQNTIANASTATAFGSQTVASGITSTAFGFNNVANGNTAFVWGQNNIASGTYSTAFGYITSATGQSTTALGESTVAEGKDSVAMGYNTNTSSYAALVIGRYNLGGGIFNQWISNDSVFEIGCGNSTVKSNCLTVYKNGSIIASNAPWYSIANPQGFINSSYANATYAQISNLTTYYAEMYNSTSGATITMTTQNIWYNITGFTAGETSGWTFNSNTLVNNKTGLYQIFIGMGGSPNNNDAVQFQMLVNQTAEAKSVITQRYSANLSNAIENSFFRRLGINDTLKFQVRDTTRAGAIFTFDDKEVSVIRIGP